MNVDKKTDTHIGLSEQYGLSCTVLQNSTYLNYIM